MSISILDPPAVEPINLADAKPFLRIDQDTEDELVAGLIVAAREAVEAATRRALISRTVLETLDAWPFGVDGAVRLAMSPVSVVNAVRVQRSDGIFYPLAGGAVAADLVGGRILFPGGPPPIPAFPQAGVQIEYVAGFGDAPANVPGSLRQAILMIAAALQQGRQGGDSLPPAARALMAPFADLRL